MIGGADKPELAQCVLQLRHVLDIEMAAQPAEHRVGSEILIPGLELQASVGGFRGPEVEDRHQAVRRVPDKGQIAGAPEHQGVDLGGGMVSGDDPSPHSLLGGTVRERHEVIAGAVVLTPRAEVDELVIPFEFVAEVPADGGASGLGDVEEDVQRGGWLGHKGSDERGVPSR